MIARDNWLSTKTYLAYLRDVRQLQENSLYNQRAHLRHLLEWADDTLFAKANTIRPTFPRYLLEQGELSVAYMRKACATSRDFFGWLKLNEPNKYRALSAGWLDGLKTAKKPGEEAPREHVEYNLDDVRRILALPDEGLGDLRDRAMVAMLFLSGIRVDAFASLRIECVELAARQIRQWPSLGVRTKNRKSATTYLLNIQDLLDVCSEWDAVVRTQLPPHEPWYALMTHAEELVTGAPGRWRAARIREHLEKQCVRAGIAYLSPHKLRHGHAVYALQQAVSMADYKAISQNLMHADLAITDSVYSILPRDEVGKRIKSLGAAVPAAVDPQVTALLAQLLEKLSG